MNRNIDNLGRIVIPAEMRKELGIDAGSNLNIELIDNKIVITNANRVDYKEKVEKALAFIKEHKFTDYEIDDERSIDYVRADKVEDLLK